MVNLISSAKYEGKNVKMIGYSDAYWYGDKDDRKSSAECCFFLDKVPISLCSKKEFVIALSSCESQYISVAMSACMSNNLT